MKHGKKPTVAQRKLIQAWGLDPSVWLVYKSTPNELYLVHRLSDKTKRKIYKEI